MNTEPAFQPAEQCVKRLLHDAETMTRQEPVKAMAIAMGAGLALTVLPTRFIVAGVTALTVTVLRPALLTLGVVKAMELCVAPRPSTLSTPTR